MKFQQINQANSVILSPHQKPSGSVIWLHGLGADGNDFVNLIPELNLPQNLPLRFIFPHAPIRPITCNGKIPMRAWFDIYSLERLEKEDKEGMRETQDLIQHLIETEIQQEISSEHIILAGFSQGGAMALLTGLHFPQKLAGILSLSAYLPLSESLATASAANKQTPVMMMHGLYDSVIPINLGQQSYQHLQILGYSAEWHDYPMGHEVCSEEIYDIAGWMQKVLKTLFKSP